MFEPSINPFQSNPHLNHFYKGAPPGGGNDPGPNDSGNNYDNLSPHNLSYLKRTDTYLTNGPNNDPPLPIKHIDRNTQLHIPSAPATPFFPSIHPAPTPVTYIAKLPQSLPAHPTRAATPFPAPILVDLIRRHPHSLDTALLAPVADHRRG